MKTFPEAIRGAVFAAINDAADIEIEKQKKIFEQELLEGKRRIVAELVRRIDIVVNDNLTTGKYNSQINLRKD